MKNVLLTLLSVCFLLGCEEDSVEPVEEKEPDFQFVGSVVDVKTRAPIPGVLVFGDVNFGFISLRDTTDMNGEFVLKVDSFEESLKENGLEQEDIDRFIRNETFDFNFGLFVPGPCSWISASESRQLGDFREITGIPSTLSVNYVMRSSANLNVFLLDTAETRNPSSSWAVDFKLQVVGEPDPFISIDFTNLEFFPVLYQQYCLPLDEQLEISYAVREYIDGDFPSVLNIANFVDTLNFTRDQIPQYIIPW
ncbi:MAG: hypothetical protein AAF694_30220 [Bacteroidota bacterium]